MKENEIIKLIKKISGNPETILERFTKQIINNKIKEEKRNLENRKKRNLIIVNKLLNLSVIWWFKEISKKGVLK